MEMNGEHKIKAKKEIVWESLNNPEILQKAIPGCESIEKLSDTELEATVKAKVGPVSAKFKGKVNLSNINAPNSYTITGEGQGGAAGFGKGSADVSLETDAESRSTILKYTAKAQVGGKIAQIGARLVDGAARKLAEEFFKNFSEQVEMSSSNKGNIPEKEEHSSTAKNDEKSAGISPFTWFFGTIIIIIALYLLINSF